MLVSESRKKGPALVLDAGNALFHVPQPDGSASNKHRARFILSAMARSHTDAFAVGARDLNAGVAWLAEQVKAAHVPALSANLELPNGTRPFPGSVVLSAGGKKLGVVGATAPATYGTATARPALHPVRAEVKALRARGVDAVVLLAAVAYPDAIALARELGAEVDLVIQAHDGRGAGSAQAVGGTWLLPAGERGRAVGRLELRLDGEGPLRDSGEGMRRQRQLEHLDAQVVEVTRRLVAAKAPDVKASLQQALDGFEKRRAGLKAESGKQLAGRSFDLTWVPLGPDVPSDAGLAAEAAKLEIPPGLH
jgi:2',3'-cyclic-nucleotide 2'-phosphodiesterase (5'-nucleotidase family)